MERHLRSKLLEASVWCLVFIMAVAILEAQASERSFVDDLKRFNFNSASQSTYDRDAVGATSPNTLAASTWPDDMMDSSTPSSGTTSMTVYKEPNGWLLAILKSLFTDIDWNTIEEARVQIAKFVSRVEQMVGKFRNVFTMIGANHHSVGGELRSSAGGSKLSARLWNKGDSSSSAAAKLDVTRVKGMLERVACFVGYARLMNLSNEALAELDASKVVTNLFGTAGKRNSSGWKWFG